MALLFKRLLWLAGIGSIMTLMIVFSAYFISLKVPFVPSRLNEGIKLLSSRGGAVYKNEYRSETEQFFYWTEKHNGKISTYFFDVTGSGYAGPIRLLVSVDSSGKLLGIYNLAHRESVPRGVGFNSLGKYTGLNSFSQTALFITKPLKVETRFGGRESLLPEVSALLDNHNAIAAISGATYTTQSVVYLLNNSVRSCFLKVTGMAL